MSKIKQSEAGFSPVEVILVLVIVGLIGVTGWLAYQNHQQAISNSAKTANTTTAPTTQTSAKPAQPAHPATVTLSADHYSFTAPYGWTIVSPKPQVGNDFMDGRGNTLHVEERYSSSGGGAYGKITANSLWLVSDASNRGITVASKSPSCTAGTATFQGMSYDCNTDQSTTKVAAFMQAQAGEVSVNGRLYVLEFTNATSGSADTSVLQNILNTFIGGAH